MSVADTKKGVEQKMQRSIEAFKNDLAKIRTGRAHTGLLDHVQVDYYGSMVPISQVANLTLVDARTIGVQPWKRTWSRRSRRPFARPTCLNPATAGDLIRVPMPALTEEPPRADQGRQERRRTAKVAIRNLRRDANEALKKLVKDKEISEDDERRASDDVQKLTDKHVAEIDKLVQSKEAEIMTV